MPTMTPDKRSAWLQKLDQECPYQITLPRRQLTDDAAIMDFLLSSHVGKFDMYRPAGLLLRATAWIRRAQSLVFAS